MQARLKEEKQVDSTLKQEEEIKNQIDLKYTTALFHELSGNMIGIVADAENIPHFTEFFLSLGKLSADFRYGSFSRLEFGQKMLDLKDLFDKNHETINKEVNAALENNKVTISEYFQIANFLKKMPQFLTNCTKGKSRSDLICYKDMNDDVNFKTVNDHVKSLTYTNQFVIETICKIFNDKPKIKEKYLVAKLINMLELDKYTAVKKRIDWEVIDRGTYSIALNIRDLLSKLSGEEFTHVSRTMLSVLLGVMKPHFTWNGCQPGPWLPNKMRDLIQSSKAFDSKEEKLPEVGDIERSKKIKELMAARSKYLSSLFDNAFTTFSENTEYSQREQLLLKLIAVDYLVKKIQSGEGLKPNEVRDGMDKAFGEKTKIMFERRGHFKDCRIKRIVDTLNYSPIKSNVDESKSNRQSIGLFKPMIAPGSDVNTGDNLVSCKPTT